MATPILEEVAIPCSLLGNEATKLDPKEEIVHSPSRVLYFFGVMPQTCVPHLEDKPVVKEIEGEIT